MRSLVVTQNITLDGVIDAAGGWFAPSDADDPAHLEELMAVQAGHRAGADALLVGRDTFEAFRGYWPAQRDADDTGVSAYLDAVEKYVVTGTLADQDLGWDRSHALRGDLAEEVTRLKAAPGREIVVTGSIGVTHALTGAGLVDEYRLWVYPVVVGSGRRLFAEGQDLGPVDVLEVRSFGTGVVLMRYRPRR